MKYRVNLLTTYCSEEIEADSIEEAKNAFRFPPEFDFNEYHSLSVEEVEEYSLEITCSHCLNSFVVDTDIVGFPPFVVECEHCGKEVNKNGL